MCNNGKLIKLILVVIACKFQNILLVIHSHCVAPIFQGGDLCVIMEKGPPKTHYLRGFVQLSDFSLVINSNCAALFFQGGNLCSIMENRPHKTHNLNGFMQNSKFVACNPFKLCGPHFPM